MERLRCQRIGCNATFTEDDNPEGSCTYHDSGPLFHDGTKQWSCCKKKSHDFSLFLEIPGCKTGKHTTEKPVIATPSATKNKAIPVPVSVPAPMTNASPKDACPRCHQGFFCSDHGSQPREAIPKASNTITSVPSESNTVVQQDHPAPVKKKIDINEPQICKNKSCSKTFTEKENHDTACSYHPGPAIFHDRMKGWKCCDVHAKEFDEFMTIPPCTKGWHNADPVS